MGEADAGVSGGAFDDGAAGLEEAEFLGVLDDVEGGAVFDAAAGVLEFGFAEDVAAGFFGEALEADEWCLSNCWNMLMDVDCRMGGPAYHRGSPAGQCLVLWRC